MVNPRPGSERWLVLSDIHGNRWALEAVLADACGRGATHVVNLGDACYGPLDPAGTLARLRALEPPILHVRGNQDRAVFEPLAAGESLAFTRAALEPSGVAWLRALPTTARSGEVLAFHGTPARDDEPLLHVLGRDGMVDASAREVAHHLPGGPLSLVLCGHTHLPRVLQVCPQVLAVNPGSVGLPAYHDAEPWPHRVEVGAPHARYAFATRADRGWRVELVAVPYDVEPAARCAERNGRPDWAHALRTGLARP
jgi:putative phosphoesterase